MAVSFIGRRNRIPKTKVPTRCKKSLKIKEVIRSRKSKKDRKYNGRQKKSKNTMADRKTANTDVQNTKRHLNAEQHEPH